MGRDNERTNDNEIPNSDSNGRVQTTTRSNGWRSGAMCVMCTKYVSLFASLSKCTENENNIEADRSTQLPVAASISNACTFGRFN